MFTLIGPHSFEELDNLLSMSSDDVAFVFAAPALFTTLLLSDARHCKPHPPLCGRIRRTIATQMPLIKSCCKSTQTSLLRPPIWESMIERGSCLQATQSLTVACFSHVQTLGPKGMTFKEVWVHDETNYNDQQPHSNIPLSHCLKRNLSTCGRGFRSCHTNIIWNNVQDAIVT